MIFGLVLTLGLVFSFSIEAFGAHGDSTITAQEVADDPGNETKMREFVNRIVNYYEHVRADNRDNRAALIRELTVFARDIRREGDYKHGDIYAMGITENLVVTNHAEYPELIGHKVNPDAGTPLADTLKALLDNSTLGTTNCAEYGQNNERVACAAKVESDLTVDVTNIAGLRHEVDDDAFVEPDCSGLTLGTTAKQVFDAPTDANLEAYVKDVIEAVQEDVAKISEEEAGKLLAAGKTFDQLQTDPATQKELLDNITTRIQERLFCFGSGDFKHGNMYIFVMGTDLEESTVFVNGNNFDLNGANLELVDDQLSGEQNIARLFNQELGDPVNGASTYVNYHWDDPLDPDDDVPNFFEDRKVPGTSPKRSYIEVANLNEKLPPGTPEDLYIFGSGTYPEEDDDSGACAIAGTEHTSQSTLLNLFLVASILLSVVFLRKRE